MRRRAAQAGLGRRTGQKEKNKNLKKTNTSEGYEEPEPNRDEGQTESEKPKRWTPTTRRTQEIADEVERRGQRGVRVLGSPVQVVGRRSDGTMGSLPAGDAPSDHSEDARISYVDGSPATTTVENMIADGWFRPPRRKSKTKPVDDVVDAYLAGLAAK